MQHQRIEQEEAIHLLREAPLLELMERAHALRMQLHPNPEVTFVVDTNPNYTNVCITDCTFCSFYRKLGDAASYTLSPGEVANKVTRAQSFGATTVLLQGGHHPDLPFDYYLALIDAIKKAAPGVHLHLFSPPEVDHMASTSGQTYGEVLARLWEAGLRTMPGGGAEILVGRVRRRISPKKISADTWIDVMRTAHNVGMKTSATMTYGHLENTAEIIEHLLRIRDLQDETGGFYAFIPWSFKPGPSPLGKLVAKAELPSYYLRIIAISRLVLDNIPHIQASWFGEGWRAGQLALNAGADDFGGLLLEENVLYEARHQVATTLDSVLDTIRDAGFDPVQRTTLYEKIHHFEDSIPRMESLPVIHRVRGAEETAPIAS